ncbi:MAG: FtsX-like permease family protein [Bacillota bacterium]|nr:FtsX-like permease family protein [Bacillota bacterium]
MISFKKLFKIYNMKTWKHSKFQICLSIIAIVVAAAILLSLRLLLAIDDAYTNINARNINDGDINIALKTPNISDGQLKVLNKLTAKGMLQYAATYKMQNNLTSGKISGVVEMKFVDSKYAYINQKTGSYVKKLGNNNVIINKVVADKFKLKKGDTIPITITIRDFSTAEKKFMVQDVIDSTSILDENILGVIILNKSNLQDAEKIKKENLATNINVSINKNYSLRDIKAEIEKVSPSVIHITTYEEGIQANKRITNQENRALEFVEILVIVITGIGISFTSFLLILKRKKDYVLLNIYGMKEETLQALILYETFIICVIGVTLGTIVSFIITGFIEKTPIREMDIVNLIQISAVPLVSTVLFIIVQTMIFTILPIALSKDINPNSILRQQEEKLGYNKNLGFSIFKMIILLAVSFSIYIGSLKTGFVSICVILTIVVILYGLAVLGINLIVKKKACRNKFLLLALRNINRQKNKFASCATALVVTLILCGFIINLGYSIIPSIMEQFVDDNGYSISLNSSFDEKNISSTEQVLNEEKSIEKYTKTIKTTAKFKSIQSKSTTNFKINASMTNLPDEDLNNIPVEAVDTSKGMLDYDTVEGAWFNSKDINKSYVVLGNNYQHLGIHAGDEMDFDIQGETFKFTVLGICSRSNFRDNHSIYIGINNFKKGDFINNSNSKIEYLINCDVKEKANLISSLNGKLPNSLIIDESVLYNELSKYILQLTNVFIYVCCVSIFSSVCLVGNILMIINFDRLKEFLMLNVVGAKNRDIRKITIIEGFIVGGVSGIVGVLISEFLSLKIITGMFESRYHPNAIIDAIMILSAIIVTIASSIIVINNMKTEKYSELLRTD